MSEKIRVGTSGWSYGDWVGPFYPEATRAGDYLAKYTECFDTVEVDSTFYRPPSARTVQGWDRNTPDGFRFALKVPGAVTHGAQGQRPNPPKVLLDEDRVLDQFLDVVHPLAPKIACLVFQFPYFRVNDMDGVDFVDRLEKTIAGLPSDFRFAVEIRNKKWIDERYLRLLSEHRIAAVMIDHPYMPYPTQQLEMGMLTTDFAYVRLLGDRYKIEEKTKEWGATVEDKSERIAEWAEILQGIARNRGVSAAYAFANNHFAGHGPATSRELIERLLEG